MFGADGTECLYVLVEETYTRCRCHDTCGFWTSSHPVSLNIWKFGWQGSQRRQLDRNEERMSLDRKDQVQYFTIAAADASLRARETCDGNDKDNVVDG